MTTAPVVELHFNPTGLRPSDLTTSGPFLGGPADAIEAALAVARAAMVDQMRKEVRGLAEPTHDQLVRIADLAWQLVAWRFRKVSAPIMADAYIHAYRAAEAGDVPMSMIYDLAEKHAEKVGDYFHTSSRDALIEGFNLSVNRRIPAKAAADRVLDAYGLTPRGMRTYVGASQFQTPVSDVMPRSIKAKARAYIDKAFTSRTRKLAKQEEHNIDEQAKQFAWMWLQSKGRLNEHAEKLWITAKDERVCKVCGPLHNQRVKVNEQFVTSEGKFWTPGLHPNCRCVIRLLEHTFKKDLYGTALSDFNHEHPRGQGGRFGTKTQERPKYSAVTRKPDTDLARAFQEIVAGLRTAHPTGRAAPSPAVIDMRTPQPVAKPAVQPVVGTRATPVIGTRVRPVGTTRKPVVGTRAEPKIKVKVETTTKPETKPAAKVKPKTIARPAAAVRTNPATQPESKVDTKAVTSTQGEAKPATDTRLYTVVTDEAIDRTHAGRVNLTRPMPLMSRTEATEYASEMIKSDIDTLTDQVHAQYNNTFMSLSGREYKLTDNQVHDVVEWQARRSAVGTVRSKASESPAAQPPIIVPELDALGRPLRDETDKPIYGSFSPDFVAQQFDVHTGLFNVQVVGIDQQYVKWEQGVAADEPGQMGGSRRPYAEGTFRFRGGDYERDTSHDVTVEILGMEPYKPRGIPKKKPD